MDVGVQCCVCGERWNPLELGFIRIEEQTGAGILRWQYYYCSTTCLRTWAHSFATHRSGDLRG